MKDPVYRYNANTGDYPRLFDRVELVRTGGNYDGRRGTIGGFYDGTAALVCLDDPLQDGTLVIVMTVVCLDRILDEHLFVSLDADAS